MRCSFQNNVLSKLFALVSLFLDSDVKYLLENVSTPGVVPHLTTDIDFPGLNPKVPQEVRASVARLHLNMGHPSRQELARLLAYQGDVPDQVYECARKLRCATCQ